MADAARAAGRSAGDVRLLAVSKKQPHERILAAYKAGLRDFGENYLQELQEHRALLPADVRWHFIGHVQSKKAKHIVDTELVHGVDSLKLAGKLAAAAQEEPLAYLVNVNISSEESKSGVLPSDLPALLRELRLLERLTLRGFMCIPSPSEEPRRAFARLRELRDAAQLDLGLTLPELSMGMSGDFADAIAEGSTIVRVGTGIFGPRLSA